MARKMKNPKLAVLLIFSFLGVVLAHLFLQYKIMEIGISWSYSQNPPNETTLSIYTALSLVLNPLTHLTGYVDSNLIRIKDYWYYVSAVAGAVLWASVILWAFLRIRKRGANKAR